MIFDFVDTPPTRRATTTPPARCKFSERMACPNDHDLDTDELEPRSFSFNSPFGACPECHGLGTRMEVDPELVVPDPQATLGEGAIQPWSQAHVADYFLRADGCPRRGGGLRPQHALGGPARQGPQVASSTGHPTKVHVVTTNRYGRQRAYYAEFEGVRTYIERRHREAESDTSRERFEGFMREVPCPACRGSRLKPVVDGGHDGRPSRSPRSVPCRSTSRPTSCATLELSARERQIAERVLKEIQERLNFLLDVGLDYLSLDRPAARCPAARPSASGWPPRSAPGSSASSTCSTSPRSGCTSATTSG